MRTLLSQTVGAALLMVAASTVSAETVKIGLIAEITGPNAEAGSYTVNGAKLAVEEINKKGGILGKQIELHIEDNQSTNPGTVLAGLGGDFDLTPQWRLSTNANHLWFANTATLQALRNEGSIPKSIGWDLSASAQMRLESVDSATVNAAGNDPGACT